MPLPIRRPGVPPKPTETRFVTGLLEATKIPGFVRGAVGKPAPVILPEAQLIEAKRAERAAAVAAWNAEIRAMSDDEFAAHLESEGLSANHYLADPYKEARK